MALPRCRARQPQAGRRVDDQSGCRTGIAVLLDTQCGVPASRNPSWLSVAILMWSAGKAGRLGTGAACCRNRPLGVRGSLSRTRRGWAIGRHQWEVHGVLTVCTATDADCWATRIGTQVQKSRSGCPAPLGSTAEQCARGPALTAHINRRSDASCSCPHAD